MWTEDAARTANQQFRLAFENSAIGMAITDGRGRIVTANEALCRLTEYREEELRQLTWVAITHPEDLPRNLELGRRMMAGELPSFVLEKRYVTRSGKIVWVRNSTSVLDYRGGVPHQVIALVEDITERREAEEALQRSFADLQHQKELLQTIVDHIPVMLNLIDGTGRFVWINNEWQRVLGWSLEEAQHVDLLEACYPDAATREDVARFVKSPSPGWRDFRTRCKDGGTIDTAWEAVVLSDGTTIGIGQDITKRKQAEEEQRMMVEELRELSARLIHAQDEERRRIARQLHETTAQDLVALKMNFAQLTRTDWASDAGRALLAESIAVVERSLCEIRTLSYLLYPPLLDEAGLASALRWYVSGFTQRSGIRVELDVPDDLRRLAPETEGTLFRIVQESLINIHRHAGSATAAVRICTTLESLMLEVQDDGRGMPPVVLKRLANSHGALGVGIAGMRERVSQLDGELQIESSDRGTTIRAIVPLGRWTPS